MGISYRLWRDTTQQPITQTEVVSVWYQVARIREREGDKEGAARARRNAQILRGFRWGPQHDLRLLRQLPLPDV